MTTQNNSNELRVEEVSPEEIESKLIAKNVDIAAVAFEAPEIEIVLDAGNSSSSGENGAATGAKVTFVDGKAENIIGRMVPITQQNTMDMPARDLDDKKKEQIKAKAEKSKEDKSRDGIGE